MSGEDGRETFKDKESEVLKDEVLEILTKRLSLSLSHQFETSSGRELLEKLRRREITPAQAADLLSGL
jgi:hypothetical protein